MADAAKAAVITDTNSLPKIRYSLDGVAYAGPDRQACEAHPARVRYDPQRGWPRYIVDTSSDAYLSGLDALNLREGDPSGSPGDWRREATWWTRTYIASDGEPHRARRWGPQGERTPAPAGIPALRDARPALRALSHPEGWQDTPVYCATLAAAVVDLAWHSMRTGAEPPDRREIERWLNEDAQLEAVRRAERVAATLGHAANASTWAAWLHEGLGRPEHQKSTRSSGSRCREGGLHP